MLPSFAIHSSFLCFAAVILITAQAKVINTVRLLKEGATYDLAARLTGTDLWELRILGSDSARVFYVAVENQTFLLLHGFKKKSFTTPKKELKLAVSRLKDYGSRP